MTVKKPRKRLRTDRLTTLWMIVAIVIEPAVIMWPGAFAQPLWASIHVVTIGIILTSIHQWSWHFAQGLLHLPPESSRARAWREGRVILIHVGLIVALIGMRMASYHTASAGAVIIFVAVVGHAIALVHALSSPFGAQFSATMRYPLCGLVFLCCGIAVAIALLSAMFIAKADDPLAQARDSLALAHLSFNVWGFAGLTISGVLVTLGPTVLRARADRRALPYAKAGLLPLALDVVLIAVANGFGYFMLAAIAELVWVGLVIVIVGIPIASAARRVRRIEMPAVSMLVGLLWLVGSACASAWLTGTATTAGELRGDLIVVYAFAAAGGVVQLIVGAMEFLMPMVIGGGPGPLKTGMGAMNAYAPARLAARHVALVLALVAGPGPWRIALAVCVALTYVAQIAAFIVTGKRQGRARLDVLRSQAFAGEPLDLDLLSVKRRGKEHMS